VHAGRVNKMEIRVAGLYHPVGQFHQRTDQGLKMDCLSCSATSADIRTGRMGLKRGIGFPSSVRLS
jgi:hypothetical protein